MRSERKKISNVKTRNEFLNKRDTHPGQKPLMLTEVIPALNNISTSPSTALMLTEVVPKLKNKP